MRQKFVLFVLFFMVFASQGISQTLTSLEQINKIWEKFYTAFDSLDYELMAEIHSKDLVRIAGGNRIMDYDTYINEYKASFAWASNNNVANRIQLRFNERICNDSVASERGIYQLSIIDSQGENQNYYGQFHVLFRKEDGLWRILMDYDSNEEDKIGEDDFVKAHPIDDLDKFKRD